MGRDSSVGIAIPCGLDGPGIESRCGGDFRHLFRTAQGSTQAPRTMGTGSFPGAKRPGSGVDHTFLVQRLKKEYSSTSNQPLVFRGPLKGELYLYLYLYLQRTCRSEKTFKFTAYMQLDVRQIFCSDTGKSFIIS